MQSLLTYGPYVVGVLAIIFLWLFVAMCFRVVVPPSEVHTVQAGNKTTAYGTTSGALGNVYYRWPSWVPRFGVRVMVLPISVFEINLKAYDGYDKDRVPFLVDIMAYFRIDAPNVAAQRISSFEDLKAQMHGVLQSATRHLLAKYDIHEIMGGRSEFGDAFTSDVNEELKEWGVTTQKSVAIMDVRDVPAKPGGDQNGVIANIMAKKTSEIEKDSRITVAENERAAQLAEVENQQTVDIRRQEAEQKVGERTADKEKAVGISQELAKQDIAAQAAVTKAKEMEILQVETVRKADITKAAALVLASQTKETAVIKAEGDKQQMVIGAEADKEKLVLNAEGKLTEALKDAEGIAARGKAQGEADTAVGLAVVAPQIELAEKQGQNKEYLNYLVELRQVEATEAVGKANAEALNGAEIKVVATGGDAASGLKNVGELIGTKGGSSFGAMLEAFLATEAGKGLLGRFFNK